VYFHLLLTRLVVRDVVMTLLMEVVNLYLLLTPLLMQVVNLHLLLTFGDYVTTQIVMGFVHLLL
jgi:hypothetical protein